jgi:hypothetical protein
MFSVKSLLVAAVVAAVSYAVDIKVGRDELQQHHHCLPVTM